LGGVNLQRQKEIQMISEKDASLFVPKDLYLAIQNCINDLCKARCGRVPGKELDCQDRSCEIKRISDDASFHFERNWIGVLKNDFIRLLSIESKTEVEEK